MRSVLLLVAARDAGGPGERRRLGRDALHQPAEDIERPIEVGVDQRLAQAVVSPAANLVASGAKPRQPTKRWALTQKTRPSSSRVAPQRRASRVAATTVRSPFSAGR